jgi:hypothetical protein
MGVNSRAVITGDVTQIDLKDPEQSGLVRIQSILGGTEGIQFIYFHPEDVVRHRLVRDIIRAFDRYHARNNGSSEDGVGTALDPEAGEMQAAGDAPEGAASLDTGVDASHEDAGEPPHGGSRGPSL